MHSFRTQLKLLAIGITTFSLLSIALFSQSTSALSGSQFRADRIIDDAVFYKGDALTANQIQNFLNAKMPSCDTYGQKMYNGSQTRAQWAQANGKPLPPYTCLKDYRQDHGSKSDSGLCGAIGAKSNRSAAEIIDDVSRACNVSQKALLVMLQKEQSLITDDWPWPVQYNKAMGYFCPDDPNNPGWCHPDYAGFFNQVYNASKQLNRYKLYPQGFNHAAGRTSYVGFQANAPQCGGTNIYMRTAATAALYNYTPYQPNAAALNNLYGTGDACSAYGNRNFWRMFNDWFGSTLQEANECDSRVNGVTCVWSVMKSDGSHFLTTSKSERDFTLNSYGWIYEGIAFYAAPTQLPGTVPTYRLRQDGRHYYTAVQSDYNSLISSGSWADEGVAFYSYPTTTTTNISHPIYRLYNSSLNKRYWTMDEYKKLSLLNSGYVLETTAFNGFSGLVGLPLPAANRINIYRIQNVGAYFYTSNINELESVVRAGQSYEGLLTTASSASSGTAIYRLQRNANYFYTSDINEKNIAVQNYGMADEGVAFYLDESSDQIYRLANSVGNRYLFTSNINETMLAANTSGWLYEGTLFSKNVDPSPVYRFLNLFNHRHFYTININEAALITNKGWKFEGAVFNASKASGLPVYRLRLNDKHFFTANSSERNLAISNYGYSDEGIGFFVSTTTTSTPVYRLQGGNDEYFYTASTSEKDNAVNIYRYNYEGEAFYLQQ